MYVTVLRNPHALAIMCPGTSVPSSRLYLAATEGIDAACDTTLLPHSFCSPPYYGWAGTQIEPKLV
jgi:hypothetical protein